MKTKHLAGTALLAVLADQGTVVGGPIRGGEQQPWVDEFTHGRFLPRRQYFLCQRTGQYMAHSTASAGAA